MDIARLSGVSIGTVDRVIHERGRVSPEAKKKVEEAIQELDYQPNIMARSLRMREIADVQIFLPEATSDEFWQLSRNGIESEIGNWSHYGINIQTLEFGLKEDLGLEGLHQKMGMPTGMVLAPVGKVASALLEWSSVNAIPTTLFNSTFPGFTPLSFNGQDLFQSGRLAADLICNSGSAKKRCVILHLDEPVSAAIYLQEKVDGFASLALKKGLNFESIFIRAESDPEKLSQLLSDSSIGSLYISTSNGTSVVAELLQDLGRKDLVTVGYDMLEANVKGLKKWIYELPHQPKSWSDGSHGAE